MEHSTSSLAVLRQSWMIQRHTIGMALAESHSVKSSVICLIQSDNSTHAYSREKEACVAAKVLSAFESTAVGRSLLAIEGSILKEAAHLGTSGTGTGQLSSAFLHDFEVTLLEEKQKKNGGC